MGDDMPTELLLVRHGESAANVRRELPLVIVQTEA